MPAAVLSPTANSWKQLSVSVTYSGDQRTTRLPDPGILFGRENQQAGGTSGDVGEPQEHRAKGKKPGAKIPADSICVTFQKKATVGQETAVAARAGAKKAPSRDAGGLLGVMGKLYTLIVTAAK